MEITGKETDSKNNVDNVNFTTEKESTETVKSTDTAKSTESTENNFDALIKNIGADKKNDTESRISNLERKLEIEQISGGNAELRSLLEQMDVKNNIDMKQSIAKQFFENKKLNDTKSSQDSDILKDPRVKELGEQAEYKGFEPRALKKIRDLLDSKVGNKFDSSPSYATESKKDTYREILLDKKLTTNDMMCKLREKGANV